MEDAADRGQVDSEEVICTDRAADEPNSSDDLSQYLAIQSLLTQFSHPDVRSDFIDGKINRSLINIQSLDMLRWTLFPQWICGPLQQAANLRHVAVTHLECLINREERLFSFDGEPGDGCLTYAQWYDALNNIAASDYWNEVGVTKRCVHYFQPIDAVKSPRSSISKTIEQQQHVHNLRIKNVSHQSGSRPRRDVKIEEIINISSSSSDLESEVDFDNRLCSSPKSNMQFQNTPMFSQREVVTPPSFELDGKMHLKEFLKIYENYFDKKYDGNSYDKTQELGKFLNHTLLEVYKIRGGRKLPYETMKHELLSWYKQEKIGGKSYWKKEFEKCVPGVGESLDLYGMKLLELAQLAFPDCSTTCAREVRTKFVNTIPTYIVSKLKDTERSLQADHTRPGKHMTFTNMMKIAKDLQNDSEFAQQTKTVFFSHTDSNSYNNHRNGSQRKNGSREIVNSRYGRSHRSPSQVCGCCGKSNHTTDKCWRAKGLCIICGEEHNINDCPRNKRRRQRSSLTHCEPQNDRQRQLN